jgi:predicted outer membrane repeat protein
LCYSRLGFNHCNFEGNFANLKGGAIFSDSVVTITIAASNFTKNEAKWGSIIYLNNSRNYKLYRSQIVLDTSSFIGNVGKYSFYLVKEYTSQYNRNLI